ncbi:MAG: NADH-quinone oxidoreductase subunit H, partial [Chloroflexi bacterium]|nr:NADH-quinone oxidoreductase subunit H [Chloroflexota bacterium]
SAIGVVGVIAAGLSSNNKYSLLGAFRAAAQMVSYEIPMILALISGAMLAGTLSLGGIVRAQEHFWLVLLQPLGFAIYFVCALAETNRNPFDLPEAESELVAGYLTEYSGIRWAMFFLGEYGNMIIVSAIATTLFLGGWQGPILPGVIWFLGKTYLLLFVFIWLRSTLPRLRADQLMEFCWKGLIPLALFNVAISALIVLLLPGNYILPLTAVNWVLLAVLILFGRRLVYRSIGFNRSERMARPQLPPRRIAGSPRLDVGLTAADGNGGKPC